MRQSLRLDLCSQRSPGLHWPQLSLRLLWSQRTPLTFLILSLALVLASVLALTLPAPLSVLAAASTREEAIFCLPGAAPVVSSFLTPTSCISAGTDEAASVPGVVSISDSMAPGGAMSAAGVA